MLDASGAKVLTFKAQHADGSVSVRATIETDDTHET